MISLRAFRAERTLAELADMIGTSPASLHRIETGDQWPGPDLINRIVTASGGRVTANDLFSTYQAAQRDKQADTERVA